MQEILEDYLVVGVLNKHKVIEVDHNRWIKDIANGYIGFQDGNNHIFYIINHDGRVERIARDSNTMTSDLTVEELNVNLVLGLSRRYFLITPENIASKATQSYILTRIPRIQVTNKDLNYNQFDRPVTFNEELV
jgi:hypothetical protein